MPDLENENNPTIDDVEAENEGGPVGGIAVGFLLDATAPVIGPNGGHQTATLFVNADTPKFADRASRFAESLNRPGDRPEGTVKSDFFTLDEVSGVLRSGLPDNVNQALGRTPHVEEDVIIDGTFSLSDANDWLDQRYTQLIVVRAGNPQAQNN